MAARMFAVVLLALVVFVCPPFGLMASEEDQARAFVEKLADEALKTIKNDSLSDIDKEKALSTLFDRSVDTGWMGRFVLGKHYRTASEAQRAGYAKLYHTYLLKTYIPKFRRYTGQTMTVLKVRADDGKQYLVQTVLENNGAEKPKIFVDYRLRADDSGGYRVIDIVGEGISLVTTQRSDFGGLISQKGFDQFLAQLEAKIKGMKS